MHGDRTLQTRQKGWESIAFKLTQKMPKPASAFSSFRIQIMGVAVSWQDLKRHELKWLLERKGLMHLAGKRQRPNYPAAAAVIQNPTAALPRSNIQPFQINGPSMYWWGLCVRGSFLLVDSRVNEPNHRVGAVPPAWATHGAIYKLCNACYAGLVIIFLDALTSLEELFITDWLIHK